ncbi:MAG: dTMP kinase, partial [Nitrosomonas sp.]
YEVLQTREPGGSSLGELVRQWLLMPSKEARLCARAELCLFLASRAQHIEEVINPALEAGKIILCDRFNDSTIAYQGIGRGLGLDYVKQLCTLICEGVTPDLTFYLDIAPEIGLGRVAKADRGDSLDRIEQEALSFHERIRKGFLQIAAKEKSRIHVIDAHQSREEVLQQVFEVIEPRLIRL